MITEQQVLKMINDAIAKRETNNQFNVAKIPSHVHNGRDSQAVSINDLQYVHGYQILPNLLVNPTDKIAGAICVVNGKLKVCDGTNWIIVGTQS